MDKEKYLEILDLVVKHFNYEIGNADNRAKDHTVDVCKYLHSEDPQEIKIRENSYLNYKMKESQKVILTQMREDVRRILLADLNDNFKNT